MDFATSVRISCIFLLSWPSCLFMWAASYKIRASNSSCVSRFFFSCFCCKLRFWANRSNKNLTNQRRERGEQWRPDSNSCISITIRNQTHVHVISYSQNCRYCHLQKKLIFSPESHCILPLNDKSSNVGNLLSSSQHSTTEKCHLM